MATLTHLGGAVPAGRGAPAGNRGRDGAPWATPSRGTGGREAREKAVGLDWVWRWFLVGGGGGEGLGGWEREGENRGLRVPRGRVRPRGDHPSLRPCSQPAGAAGPERLEAVELGAKGLGGFPPLRWEGRGTPSPACEKTFRVLACLPPLCPTTESPSGRGDPARPGEMRGRSLARGARPQQRAGFPESTLA